MCVCVQVYLSYNNVSALKILAARNNWRLSSEKDKVSICCSVLLFSSVWGQCLCCGSHEKLEVSHDSVSQVRLYTLEQKSSLSFRIEAEVDVPAHRAFCLLAELSNRPTWDKHYQWGFNTHTETGSWSLSLFVSCRKVMVYCVPHQKHADVQSVYLSRDEITPNG